MKKYRTVATILPILMIFPIIKAGAAGISEYILIEKLVEKYITKSSQAENISLTAEKPLLDDYTIVNSISELEKQIESNENTISKLESGKGSGTLNEQRYQADYQRIYGCELEMKLELYKMQEQLDLLYAEYSEKITEQQTKQLEFDAYTILWNINSNSDEQVYLNGMICQKEHELSVMRETLKLGYATESDVLAAEAELEQVKSEFAVCENEQNVLLKKYELGADEKLGEFLTEYAETAYSTEAMLKRFEKNSFYPEYYRRQVEIYKAYADTLEKLKNGMTPSSYNSEYFDRVQDYITGETEYYYNEAAIAENNAKRYSESLELFVYETCGSVNSFYSQRTAAAASLKAAEKQLEISHVLLEEGRINETALMEAENSVLKLKYELAEIEANIMCIRFILDNLIENF